MIILAMVSFMYSVMLINSKLWVFQWLPLESVQAWKLKKGRLMVPGIFGASNLLYSQC